MTPYPIKQITADHIRSFVRREGRMTPSQRKAIDQLLPHYGVDENQSIIDFTELFGREAKVCLDIGFGNGISLIELAQPNPECDFLGIEVYRPGVGHLLHRIHDLGINNIRVCTEDAVETIGHRIAPDSISAIYVLFPDPWPKKQHHKRRLLNQSFIDLVSIILKDDAQLHIATDWTPYANAIKDLLDTRDDFNLLDAADNDLARPTTKFENRGRRLGHTISDMIYRYRKAL